MRGVPSAGMAVRVSDLVHPGCCRRPPPQVLAGVLPPERGGKVTLRKHTRLVYVEQEPMLPPGALAEDFIFASDAPAVAAARAFREAAAKAEEAAVGVEEQPHGGEAAAAAKAAQASLARATDRMEASGGWRLQQEVEEVTRRMGVEHLMKRSAESLSGEDPRPRRHSHPPQGTSVGAGRGCGSCRPGEWHAVVEKGVSGSTEMGLAQPGLEHGSVPHTMDTDR